MSNHYLTGEIALSDFDLRYVVTIGYCMTAEGPKPTCINIIRIVHSGYELPADEGFDPEPLIFDVRHIYQEMEFDKRLMADFEDDILQAVREHAAVNVEVAL
jgi:hypothetical protein